MREVLIKNTYEIIEQLLLRLSCCANSKKSKQIFNGRLKAILLIFQRRRKKSDRRGHQHFSHTFPQNKATMSLNELRAQAVDNEKFSQDSPAKVESRRQPEPSSKPSSFSLRAASRVRCGLSSGHCGTVFGLNRLFLLCPPQQPRDRMHSHRILFCCPGKTIIPNRRPNPPSAF